MKKRGILKRSNAAKIARIFLFCLVFVALAGIVISTPSFNPVPTSQNLTEDVLFTLYVNATDNENGLNSTLVYTSVELNTSNDEVELFNLTTIAGDPSVGLVNFTPNQSDVGNYTIQFIVQNNQSEGDLAIVTYQILEVNDAPIIEGIENQSVNEDTNPPDNWVDLWQFAYDEESNDSELDFSILQQTDAVLINCSVVTDRYINCTNPAANQSGYSDITVNVTDGSFSDTGEFRVTVAAVNDAPYWTAPIPEQQVAEDSGTNSTINLSEYASDPDTPLINLTFYVVGENSSQVDCNINADRQRLDYAPAANWYGVGADASNCSIIVSDGTSNSTNNTFNINVTSVNDPPVLSSIGNLSAVKGFPFSYDANATDVENDTLYFYDNTTLFEINITTGIISFTPNSSQVGDYVINISVNDTSGDFDSEIINFTVRNNTAPSLDSIGPLNATEDSEFSYDANATDAESDTIYFYDNTTLFEINITTGIINFTPNNSQVGSYWINISVNDTYGAVSSEVINFTVINVNDAPVLDSNIPNQTWQEDTTLTGLDLGDYFSDPDNDTLTFTASSVSNIAISISSTTNVVSFTPSADFYGVRYVTFYANDGTNITASNNITLNVTNVEEQVVTVSRGGGGSTKKVSISIYPKESLTIAPDTEKIVEFGIKNTGDVSLTNLELEVSTDIEDMLLSLSEKSLGVLIPRGITETKLAIITKDIKPGTYKIVFHAKSSTRNFKQNVTIYVNIAGREKLTRIQFVKDMFKENPRCLELNELVLKAEKLLETGETAEANKLIETAIEGCKDLISVVEERREGIFKRENILRLGGIIGTILIFTSVGVGYLIRELKSSKKREKEKIIFKT
jgi:hypothetical protein